MSKLLDGMTPDDLLRAVVNGLKSNFLTARAAGRRMILQTGLLPGTGLNRH